MNNVYYVQEVIQLQYYYKWIFSMMVLQSTSHLITLLSMYNK